jgi:hypothetical protein
MKASDDPNYKASDTPRKDPQQNEWNQQKAPPCHPKYPVATAEHRAKHSRKTDTVASVGMITRILLCNVSIHVNAYLECHHVVSLIQKRCWFFAKIALPVSKPPSVFSDSRVSHVSCGLRCPYGGLFFGLHREAVSFIDPQQSAPGKLAKDRRCKSSTG